MSKWNDDYIDSDAFLGYDDDVEPNHAAMPNDAFGAGGASGLTQAKLLLPNNLHQYANFVASGVRRTVGWLDDDRRRDALAVAAAALCKVAAKRDPQYTENQFRSLISKSVYGELRRHYKAEIEYRQGKRSSPPDSGVIDDNEDNEPTKPRKATSPHSLVEPAKIEIDQKRYRYAKGLLPDRLYRILRRRLDRHKQKFKEIAADIHVSIPRIYQLMKEGEAILYEKLARLAQGEKLQVLIRETVMQDPAYAKCEPYQIDEIVRLCYRQDARQLVVTDMLQIRLHVQNNPANAGLDAAEIDEIVRGKFHAADIALGSDSSDNSTEDELPSDEGDRYVKGHGEIRTEDDYRDYVVELDEDPDDDGNFDDEYDRYECYYKPDIEGLTIHGGNST